MLNKITINIIGSAGSGKTTIQHLISKTLEENGFLVDIVNEDYILQNSLNEYNKLHQPERLNSILKKTEKIIITETQLGRNLSQ